MSAAESRHPTKSKSGILAAAALVAVGILLGLGAARWMGQGLVRDEDRNASEMEEAVRSAMEEPSAFERSRSLTRILSGLDEDNVDGALRGMRTRSEFLDPVDLQVFLSAWTRFDPEAAMREATDWPSEAGREIGMRIVMREWAASGRVLEAVNYYQTTRDSEQRAMLAGPLFRGWALSGDIDGALEPARSLWENGAPGSTLDGLVRGALSALGPEEVIERMMALDPARGGDFERRLMRATLNLSAQENPRAAAAAYARLEGEAFPDWLHGALKVIARPWAERDPRAAIEWLLERTDRPERTVILKELMRDWALHDLESAWGWWQAEAERAETQAKPNRPLRAILLAPMLRRMAEFRPVEASKWVEQVEKPTARDVLIRRIAYFWAGRNPNEAQAWVDSLSLSPEQAALVGEAMTRAQAAAEASDEDSTAASPNTDGAALGRDSE